MLKILVIGGKRLHIVGWGAKIDKALLDWWHWDRDTVLADKKKGLIDRFLGDKMSSMGWLRWESVAEQTWLKREAETQWSEKRLPRRRFKEGEPRSQTNSGVRLNSSTHAEAKHAKKPNKINHGGHICMILATALICVLMVFSLTALWLHYVQRCVRVNSNVWRHKWEHLSTSQQHQAGYSQRGSGHGYSK